MCTSLANTSYRAAYSCGNVAGIAARAISVGRCPLCQALPTTCLLLPVFMLHATPAFPHLRCLRPFDFVPSCVGDFYVFEFPHCCRMLLAHALGYLNSKSVVKPRRAVCGFPQNLSTFSLAQLKTHSRCRFVAVAALPENLPHGPCEPAQPLAGMSTAPLSRPIRPSNKKLFLSTPLFVALVGGRHSDAEHRIAFAWLLCLAWWTLYPQHDLMASSCGFFSLFYSFFGLLTVLLGPPTRHLHRIEKQKVLPLGLPKHNGHILITRGY